jgi:hypothetical protein
VACAAWHGGSFAKFGFSFGWCGFANVHQMRWQYEVSKIIGFVSKFF